MFLAVEIKFFRCSFSENYLKYNEPGKGRKIYYFADFLVKDNHTAIWSRWQNYENWFIAIKFKNVLYFDLNIKILKFIRNSDVCKDRSIKVHTVYF